MADGDDNQPKRTVGTPASDDSSSDIETIDLDLVSSQNDRPSKRAQPDLNPQQPAMHDQNVRKEDNPFSFRHFINTADRSYHNQGARPKVFCEGRPVSIPPPSDVEISDQHMSSRLVNEYPSALPDFVQDHLVIEQCYLNNHDNLPDCTMDRSERDRNERVSYRPQAEFPLDLPLSGEAQNRPTVRNSPQVIAPEVGNSKSLPDFLADTAPGGGNVAVVDNEGSSAEWEADRLRVELDGTRRQLAEKTRLADCLAQELDLARSKNHEYTQNLAKAWEQVEENLERSKIRATSSENNIMKLRQEVKLLNKEVSRLKRENMALKSEEGAAGGPCASTSRIDPMAQRHVAQDLRSAASTAEHSLRQLLSGVENLRLLASRVENLSRYEAEQTSYISDDDADDDDDDADAGPAL
ncbi:endosome-associated-trafficking regulator 1-like [Atheta coriaria]|uniref:endosome-associated-trafficking regulator 1-like n=1 Tax=Dalotia coriaria TaxID=877792 RepID=UPI0031F33B00